MKTKLKMLPVLLILALSLLATTVSIGAAPQATESACYHNCRTPGGSQPNWAKCPAWGSGSVVCHVHGYNAWKEIGATGPSLRR